MSPSPILSIVHNITIDTMLNFNSGNNVSGPKDGRYKQTLKWQTARGMNGIHFTNESVKPKREAYLWFVLLLWCCTEMIYIVRTHSQMQMWTKPGTKGLFTPNDSVTITITLTGGTFDPFDMYCKMGMQSILPVNVTFLMVTVTEHTENPHTTPFFHIQEIITQL